MSISSFALQSNFNVKNAMASNTLTDLMRVRKETIRNCMADFENEDHKLENVLTINGHDFTELADAIDTAQKYEAGPTMIMANTIKGKGVDFMEDKPGWHYGGLDSELVAKAKASIGEE